MAPQNAKSGRVNRAGSRKTPSAVDRSWQHANTPVWIPATQSPPSKNRVQQNTVSQGGVQTGGDVTQPQVAPHWQPTPRAAAPEQSHSWWSAENQSDTLIHRNRHGYFQKGTERSGRVSSMPDPPASGPVMPSFKVTNVTWNWQAGTGAAYEDDLHRPYSWLGQQDGSWSQIYGGTPGFFRFGPGGTPVNTPHDGPQRIYGGPAHGLHSWSPPDRVQTERRYATVPQMVAARVDRLSNSRVGGQSYSQTTQHQGAPRRGGA